MVRLRKITSVLLAFVLALSVLSAFSPRMGAEAAESDVATPSLKVKKINNDTGVKLIIGKTKGADWYRIEYTDIRNEYSDYIDPYSFQLGRGISMFEEDGTKKRTYTIKGLPEGTYTIKVTACSKTGGEAASKEKKVKIKAGKKVSRPTGKTYDFSNVKAGDVIKFGSYEQDADMNNGTEDIEWIVLSKDSGKMLVISKYILDFLEYNNSYHYNTTWEECSLRKWLNEVFINKAFDKAERKMIKTTKVKPSDNPQYGTKGGKATKDKVFLLSYEQATNSKYGFSEDPAVYDINRRSAPTEYVLSKDGNSTEWATRTTSKREEVITDEGKYSMSWHLRTPGDVDNYVTFVPSQGWIFLIGNAISETKGIRPAMYISLK